MDQKKALQQAVKFLAGKKPVDLIKQLHSDTIKIKQAKERNRPAN